MGWKRNLLGIAHEIKIWPYWQVLYAQIRICPRNETQNILWDSEIQKDYQIPTRRQDIELIYKKKELAIN